MVKVEFSPEARDDLRDIWFYIASDNPQAADDVIREAERAVERLAVHPLLGVVRKDYKSLRMWPLPRYRNYLIFYRLRESVGLLEIVRVLSGSEI